MESDTSNAPLRTNEIAPFDSPVRITFMHYRARSTDMDGISVKAAIDGAVACGILTDDSPLQVKEIVHQQIKSGDEKTVMIIEEL